METRNRSTGGAFGRDNWLSPVKSASTRDNNRFQSFDQRVEFGKKMEGKVLLAMRNLGLKVRSASPQEDMQRKIDGWLYENGKEQSLQIKYRDTGDDILMEVVKNFYEDDLQFNGRDMVGQASLYVCLNREGTTIRVRQAAEAKEMAMALTHELMQEYEKTRRTSITRQQGQIRMSADPSSGNTKIMAYLTPSAFKSKQDYRLNLSLWTDA